VAKSHIFSTSMYTRVVCMFSSTKFKLRPSAGGSPACDRDTEVRVAEFDTNAFEQGFGPEAGNILGSALPNGASPLKNSVPFERLKALHLIH
jgi:hypothetical protein